ncbi:MAG: hypothetical protein WBJ10_15510 [Daejeonella sp.]|uniref:hypothetical protein n=1 Tax=Daejeonella sp. TaxID=2805397 RepID=UPI003C77AB3A
MSASAFFLGIVGITLSLLPQEVENYFDLPAGSSIVLQLGGALYFGFAMLNWMAKGNLIGGIFSKPVAVGNFGHFFVAGLALLKYTYRLPSISYIAITALVIYLAFALLFGYVVFVNPVSNVNPASGKK